MEKVKKINGKYYLINEKIVVMPGAVILGALTIVAASLLVLGQPFEEGWKNFIGLISGFAAMINGLYVLLKEGLPWKEKYIEVKFIDGKKRFNGNLRNLQLRN